MEASHFFISRAGEDREWAKWVAKLLETEGHSTTLQDYDFRPGHSILHQMKKAEDRANHFIAIISPQYLSKPFTLSELYSAIADDPLAERRLLIPIRVADCEIPRLIKDIAYVDFVGKSEGECRGALLDAIRSDRPKGYVQFPGSAPRQCRVYLDCSYNQEQWYAEPTLEVGYSSISKIIAEPCCVHGGGYDADGSLRDMRVLILPTPFRSEMTESECTRIFRWVQAGGGLLLTGIYLMEAHHRNNLNRLARRFGIEFRHDLAMPVGRDGFRECMAQAFAFQDRALWIESEIAGTPPDHPILQDVGRIGITSSCTLEAAERPDLAVHTRDEVSILHAKGYKDPSSGRLVRLTDYVPDHRAPAAILMALQAGRGRVVAVGSWKVFLNEFVNDKTFGNATLLYNTLSWLAAAAPSD
jgi:TIR domain